LTIMNAMVRDLKPWQPQEAPITEVTQPL
jgi:hypothetical protein